MVLELLLLAVTAVLVTAEQAPCITGEQQCKGYQSLSIVNNNYYCCGNGFNLQWKSLANNDKTPANCVCNRQFDEIDCIQGQTQCRDATSFISDGYNVKCCKYGYSMNSVSNSFINGVKVDYCKCTRYNSNGGTITSVGGVSRPMTEAERAQFANAMGQFSQDLQTGLNHMQRTLSENLGLLNRQLGNGFIGRFAGGLRQSINNVVNQFGAPSPQPGSVTSFRSGK